MCEALARVAEPLEETDEEESPTPADVQQPGTEAGRSQPQHSISVTEPSEATRKPAAKTEPPTRTVDPMYHGDHVTITEAIETAAPGDRILVRPGLYEEGLVVDKSLELIGQGDLERIVVRARGSDALLFKTTMGRVSNMTFQQVGGEGQWYGVDISQGHLELEGCDISSQSNACVSVHGGAHPYLRPNRIHDGRATGVLIYGNTGAILDDNDIFANSLSGVYSRQSSDPTVRGNRINKNGYKAVRLDEGGGGIYEDNDLTDNSRGAWDISWESEQHLHRDRNKE